MSDTAGTQTLDRFLGELYRILDAKNGSQLQDYLVIEPPFSNVYISMISELRSAYPRGREDGLEEKCGRCIPQPEAGEESLTWTAFAKFLVQYFGFVRDVNIDNLLETYNMLSELVQKCNSALSHPSHGILVLPTVISYSRVLARLAIGLDKKPELIAHLTTQSTDEGGGAETLPEKAANIIRQAFVTCLNDRAPSALGVRDGRPDGKKVGIYKIANICLKILFSCRKTRNAEQILVNIYNQSPPLSAYPRAQRVTYLYYLGRFMFSNNHFHRAHLALGAAYAQCHRQAPTQRRLITIFLMTSGIILGRFPSQTFYMRSEAVGLSGIFRPICNAIARGDLAAFRQLTDLSAPNARWLVHFRILLQLQSRCEILVWRSLARKTFIVSGNQGDADRKRAPTLSLENVLIISTALEERALQHSKSVQLKSNGLGSLKSTDPYTDPDFDGEQGEALQDGTGQGDEDSAFGGPMLPDSLEVESIFASLISQGLLNGYISHRQQRFAIQGAKRAGPLQAGFPNVWQTVKSRSDEEVPGWKRDGTVNHFAGNDGQSLGRVGPGTVVNLSGARPAGVGP